MIRSLRSYLVAGVVILLGVTVFSVAASRAADPEWRVGVARTKITPEQPVFVAGSASRNKPFERVETDLFAKALALEDRQGNRAVLVTTDLIGLSAAVAEPICERLHETAGLARQQILLNSSHIHTGPALSLSGAPAENRSSGDAERTVAYTKQLQGKIVDVVRQALKHLEPARLSHGVGVVNFVMNRREFTPRGVILGVNARGQADRSVPVLRIESPDGKL